MDVSVLSRDRNPTGNGGASMVTKLARNTIYSKRWVVDLLLLILLTTLLMVLVDQRRTYENVVRLGKSNNQILEQIKSCTDPKGECATRGRRQTQDARNQISAVSIAAAYCASKTPPPVSALQVKACVDQEIGNINP